MSKIASIDSSNLSPLGGADTRDLDPFGSALNQSLGLFGGANISELYPLYLKLSPDSVDQISDFSSLHFTKGVSGTDFVNQTDSIFVTGQFRRLPTDFSNAIDEIQSFAVDKKLFDTSAPIDFPALLLSKPFNNTVDNLQDLKYLSFTKNAFDLTNPVNDSLESIVFNKGLFDTPLPVDQIQSFDVTKLLQDFANPVDYVGIPDGSTFQLLKTLRNTVLLSDDQSFAVIKSLNDFSPALDVPYLNVNKPFSDSNSLFDSNTLSFNKALFDIQSVDERSILDFNKVLIDIEAVLDLTLLNLNKPLSDFTSTLDAQFIDFTKSVKDIQLTDDAIQSFNVTKLLQDYANPVDLVGIPDGSTFSFNKTLRNTVDNIADVISLYWVYNRSHSDSVDFINDAQLLHFAKKINDSQTLFDEIQSFTIGKVLQDSQSTSELLSFVVDKVLTSDAIIEERKYAHLSKTFADDFLNKAVSFRLLTVNTDLTFNNALIDLQVTDPGFIDFNNAQYALPTSSTIFDKLVSVNIGKGLFDSVLQSDQIQSFSINKVLNDYANPVDYVGIPDGSTFQLLKTLRNTILIEDQASLVWYFNRAFANNVSTSDLITFIGLGKQFDEIKFVNDDIQFLILDKSVFDAITPVEFTSLSVDKPFTDGYVVSDANTLNVSKRLIESITLSDNLESLTFGKNLTEDLISQDAQSFAVTKLLEDYVNPVDLINIPDGSTFQLNKTLRNTVLLSDDQSFVVDKNLNDSQLVAEQKYISLLKRRSDTAFTTDNKAISLSKSIKDFVTAIDDILLGRKVVDFAFDSTNITEISKLGIGKSLSDSQSTFDVNTLQVDLVKADIQSTDDAIQSFDVNKLLQDYANPIDLVGIPDGSTFQFNKTLRNTVLTSDQTSLVWYFNREFFDEQVILDAYNLSTVKRLSDISKADDDYALIINKSLFDFVTVLDLTKFDNSLVPLESASTLDSTNIALGKLLSDNTATGDQSVFSFNKVNIDTVSINEAQAFDVTKLLQDYANPIDLVNIPDGSTFILNKTLRNTVLLDDTQSFVIDKSLFDSQTINESLAVSFRKFLYDKVSVSDLLQTSGIEADRYSDFTTVDDNTSLGIQKTLSSRLGDAAYYTLENNLDFNADSGSYDIQSYDGIVDLNNTDFYISGVILDNETLSFTKGLNENPLVGEFTIFTIDKKLVDKVILEDAKRLSYSANKSDTIFVADALTRNYNKALTDTIVQSEFQSKVIGKYFTDFVSINDNTAFVSGTGQSAIDSILLSDANRFALNKVLTDIQYGTDRVSSKSINKVLRDFISIADSANIGGEGNDYTSSQGDLSNIEDFGSLYMTDYADITYFAQDYVGETRSFT